MRSLLLCLLLSACGQSAFVESQSPLGVSVPGTVPSGTVKGSLLYQTDATGLFALADATYPEQCRDVPVYYNGIPGMVEVFRDGEVADVLVAPHGAKIWPGQEVWLSTTPGAASLDRVVESGDTPYLLGVVRDVPVSFNAAVGGQTLPIWVFPQRFSPIP